MDFLDTLSARNMQFAENGFMDGLKMLPSERTLIVGCVDSRVDPVDVFGLKTGVSRRLRENGGRPLR